MRVLLDTNVLAIGGAEHHLRLVRPSAEIWLRWQAKEFDLLVSEHLMEELARTLRTAWFQERLTQELLFFLPVDVRKQAIFVDVTHEVHGVASHWQDDLILAAAVSGNADFLVTRDKEFRRVGEYGGVKIRTPAEFLIELDAALESG